MARLRIRRGCCDKPAFRTMLDMAENQPCDLKIRWQQKEQELADLYDGNTQNNDPIQREAALLREQDEIEFALGEAWMTKRRFPDLLP